MKTHTIPSPRLQSAIPYVEPGARVADIGTDHAYLPIHLVAEGIASAALAADIRPGPIASAVSNIRAAGLEGRIETMLTDGLYGVERFAPDTVLIFGMGGELIARILSDAPWVRSQEITLVLQPMSRGETLYRWLAENGFAVREERLTREKHRIYRTLSAVWDGVVRNPDPVECLLGRYDPTRPPPHMSAYLRHEIEVLEAVIAGKEKARDPDVLCDRELLSLLQQRLEELKE